jgi:muramoyltetrapeptide carboxypeptidase
MIKSKRLEKGQTIGVVSPSSPSYNRSDIVRGKETFEAWGYKVVLSKNLNKTKGLVAASEEERAEDINEMFKRDDIDAVFVSQGGYGSAQIISRIDYDVIKNNPKIFTGFSDITSLHLAIHKFANVMTFHGPGFSRFNKEDLTDYTKEYFFKAIGEQDPIGEIRLADDKKWIHPLGTGVCEAPIIGGNLTLICSSLGTPYEIETKGKILLIEDLDTEPWVMDHMLSHLRNAGKLEDLAGIVVGECLKCEPRKLDPGYFCDTSLEDVLQYYIEPLKIPALYGFPLGHTKDLATIPMGAMARLDCSTKQLIILESGVI